MRDILFFPLVIDSVVFQDYHGPGLPNQATKLQNSIFPTYKRTLHHNANMWMRTKHVEHGALDYHRKKKAPKAILISTDCGYVHPLWQ